VSHEVQVERELHSVQPTIKVEQFWQLAPASTNPDLQAQIPELRVKWSETKHEIQTVVELQLTHPTKKELQDLQTVPLRV
jgi:hypothetical protein